jgi:hypothetical protein
LHLTASAIKSGAGTVAGAGLALTDDAVPRYVPRKRRFRALLGVDAAGETGTAQLYESVGVRVAKEDVIWQKTIV